jgi:hypothetical protein
MLGDAAEPIRMTSLKDDFIYGDTNNDGQSYGEKGDWVDISIENTASQCRIEYCEFHFGQTTIVLKGGAHTVEHCGIQNGQNDGISIQSGIHLVNSNNIEYCGGYAISLGNSAPEGIRNNRGYGNKTNGILISGEFQDDFTLNNTNHGDNGMGEPEAWLPYVLSGTDYVIVPMGRVLTLAPGVVVKGALGSRLTVEGTILSNGTADEPIFFTSVKDDSRWGPTYEGELPRPIDSWPPWAGDWDGVRLTSETTTSAFSYCRFYYGGDAALEILNGTHSVGNCYFETNTASLLIDDGDTSVVDCEFTGNPSRGHNGDVVLAGGSPTISDCQIHNDTNHTFGIHVLSNSWNGSGAPTITGNNMY